MKIIRPLLYSLLFCLGLAFAQNLSQVQNLYTSPNNYPARGVAYSPDGSLLALALWDGGSIKILEADSGREVASLVGHTWHVNSVAFSPDGSFLASGSTDNTVKIWRTADFSLVASLEEHTYNVTSVAFSPAGDFLASGSIDSTVKIWRTADFSLVASLEEHTNIVYSVAFSPAGDFLASGSDDSTVKIWRTADFSLVASLEEHTFWVRSVAFSPAGDFLASGSSDDTIKIWHTTDFSLVASLEEHTSEVRSVAFSPAGDFLASGSNDNTVKIWHVNNDSFFLHRTIAGANGSYWIGSVAFHPAGTSLAFGNMSTSLTDGVVSLWGTPSRQAIFCPSGCGAAPPEVQYATITINSTAGASVTINGQAIPETSAGVFAARIQEGTYQVQARKDGYVSASASLQARLQGSNQLNLVLQEIPAPVPPPVVVTPQPAPSSQPTQISQPTPPSPPIRTAQRRLALVIGNNDYPQAQLDNPINDARDMAAALRRLQFEVYDYYDSDRTDMINAFYAFEDSLQAGDIALLYFAGHGVEVDSTNYLIPAKAEFHSERDVRAHAVSLPTALRSLDDGGAKFSIVILDACRNNPFRGLRDSGGGLAEVQTTQRDFNVQDTGAQGTLIAFSTAALATASDGDNQANSPYTALLLQYINTPNLEIKNLFGLVRNEMIRQSNGNQQPWVNFSSYGDFYFVPR